MNQARFATDEEIAHWDTLVQTNPGQKSFFQEQLFLAFKAKQKISPWRARYVVHMLGKQTVYVGYLAKPIFGLGEFWYAPFGPAVTNTEHVNKIVQQLTALAPRAFTLLLEPTIAVSSKSEQQVVLQKMTDSVYAAPVQPNVHTVIVPTLDTKKLFSTFKQRTRRAIRQAEKAAVSVKKVDCSEKTRNTFFKMYHETASRAGFFIRNRQYYETFWNDYHNAGKGDFFFAYKEGVDEPVAGAFILYDTEKALYKDGASIRDGLPNGTLHLLHWEIMKWLEEQDIKSYDLHGVPPSWLQDDKSHRQYGLGIFKTSFGETTDTVGAIQYKLRPLEYTIWSNLLRKIYFTLSARRGGFFF